MADGHAHARRSITITPSGEIYLKSRPTRKRFMGTLADNIRAATRSVNQTAVLRRSHEHEFRIDGEDLDPVAEVVARVFGVGRVETVDALNAADLPDLADHVAAASIDRVRDKRFAVRVRRRGEHDWRSHDAEVMIGSLLLDASAGVDLSNPEETVRVRVRDDQATLVARSHRGADGLPIGTQDRGLVLLSGGIDSPVAAWMMMRRGCPVDFLHVKMDCAGADHALAVGYELVRRWGDGMGSRFHVIDFQPMKDAIKEHVDNRLRQVVLKQLMLTCAREIGGRKRIPLIITGDSLGQVSSQTSRHLVALDLAVGYPILRPLVGMSKDEIVHRARDIGTFELSIRGKENCDLSEGGRVATAASDRMLRRGMDSLDPSILAHALATWETLPARDWLPGITLEPAA